MRSFKSISYKVIIALMFLLVSVVSIFPLYTLYLLNNSLSLPIIATAHTMEQGREDLPSTPAKPSLPVKRSSQGGGEVVGLVEEEVKDIHHLRGSIHH